MSSAVISTSAALRRPFLFDAEAEPEVGCHPERSGKGAQRSFRGVEGSLPATVFGNQQSAIAIVPASRLEIRPAPEMASTGISELDALTGGLPRGCLTEICGPASSGRTSVLLSALAAATHRGEYCALIDASDALDPHFAASAGVDLDHLLWVRCSEDFTQKKHSPQRHRGTEKKEGALRTSTNGKGTALAVPDGVPTDLASAAEGRRIGTERIPEVRHKNYPERDFRPRTPENRLEQLLRATDLLLESGGFGLIVLDLAEVPLQAARRIPLTTWFRFRRAVEHKPTILLAIEQLPIAGSCSSLLLQLGANDLSSCARLDSRGRLSLHEHLPSHAHLLTGLNLNAELIRSRLDRKPAHSITFETKTAWAG